MDVSGDFDAAFGHIEGPFGMALRKSKGRACIEHHVQIKGPTILRSRNGSMRRTSIPGAIDAFRAWMIMSGIETLSASLQKKAAQITQRRPRATRSAIAASNALPPAFRLAWGGAAGGFSARKRPVRRAFRTGIGVKSVL